MNERPCKFFPKFLQICTASQIPLVILSYFVKLPASNAYYLPFHMPGSDQEGATYFGELEEAFMHQVASLRRTQAATTSTAHHGDATRKQLPGSLSLSLSLSLSTLSLSGYDQDQKTHKLFSLSRWPRLKAHKLMSHFCNGLGHCSQKQPCRSSRRAVVQLCYGVCDSDNLVIPLSLSLSLSCSKLNPMGHGHGSTPVPHYQLSGSLQTTVYTLQAHKFKENNLHSLSLPQWPPTSPASLVIPMLSISFSFISARVLQIHVLISFLPYDIFLQPFPLQQLQRLQLGHLLHWTSSQLGL